MDQEIRNSYTRSYSSRDSGILFPTLGFLLKNKFH